jgi:hypothetical protein
MEKDFWRNASREEKVRRIEMVIGVILIISSIIFIGFGIFKKYSFPYFFPLSFGSFILAGYSFFLTFIKSFDTLPISSRIEGFIGLLSATLLFGAFFLAFLSNDINMNDEFSSIYSNNFQCPSINNESYTQVNLTLSNSDLTRGIGVYPKFIGKGICINVGDKCEARGEWKGIMILAGNDSTLRMELKKIRKNANYQIELYNIQGFKISNLISCDYNY